MIPVYAPSIGEREREYVLDCVDSGWVSSRGDYIDRFESTFANYLGVDFATSVSNGTVALHLALATLDIGPGDEVIVPTFTYVASVNAILYVGATPVYVESDVETCQVDCDDIARKITEKTRAIMAVHLYGQSSDMSKLVDISRHNDLILIEDCAEALGSKFNDRLVGTFGDVATFSFFGNKTLTTGEGGMVVFKDEKKYLRGARLKTQGVHPEREYWHDMLAFNYRMTNICAAIGCAQMERLDETIARKREIASLYSSLLSDLPFRLHSEAEGTTHSFWMCSIILDAPELRDELRAYLKSFGTDTRPFFHPAHKLPHLAQDKEFPIAEFLASAGINLPSYPDLKDSQIDFISSKIRDFYN